MKILSNFDDYINELKLLEALRTFPLYLSKRLRDMLSQIDHEIAKELLSKHSDIETRVKQTFVDIHDSKSDSITFIQPNKAVQVLNWDDITDDEQLDSDEVKGKLKELGTISDNNDLYKKFRSETKWGRFINASFPGKFQQSLPGGQNKKDIESFVNLYKSLYTQDDKFQYLDIVNGDDIAYWYHCDRYDDYDGGTLGDSCMKHEGSDTFELYTNNPDKVNLVIMYGDDRRNTIRARALLWTLSEPDGRKFMDRVYTNDYSDEQIFIDYAKKNNWLYKSRQGMGSEIEIADPQNDTISRITMMAELVEEDYNKYPYCDTMTFYNPNTGKISNKSRYNPKYELTDTGGGYYTIDDYEQEPEYVYSNYHQEEIDKNHAKYCVFGNDWVDEDDAIRVWNSSEWGAGENYAVPGHPDVVESKFTTANGDIYNKHFPKTKCIWSNYLNTWVFKWSARKVWGDFERTYENMRIDHKKNEGVSFYNINEENWDKDLVTSDGQLKEEVGDKIIRPVGERPQGWHRKIEFVDEDGNLFRKGIFQGKI